MCFFLHRIAYTRDMEDFHTVLYFSMNHVFSYPNCTKFGCVALICLFVYLFLLLFVY